MSDDFLIDAARELLDAIDAAQKIFDAVNAAADANLPKEIAEIVKNHSAGAAAAGVAAGLVPGAGGVAAVGVAAGFVWTMYGRINAKIGLPFNENVIKSVASGVATNLASYALGGLVISTVFSFFPGLGSVGSSVVVGGTCYALTVGSGYVYLKVLTNLFRSGKNPTTMNADELKAAAKTVAAQEDMKAVIEQAKTAYKQSKKA